MSVLGAPRWHPNDRWQVAGTLGQRTRFPSLRELYGEALGQFLVNPGLHPETAILGDLTFERVSRDGMRMRQRYNLAGSDGHGVEAQVDWNVDDRLELRIHANWQALEARVEKDGTARRRGPLAALCWRRQSR